ncbi:MAG: type I-F CRISPR-associated protein Csy3 [Methylobacter sp.]|nr:type I-F CRISPR-associated protein Csy3 [Methylobacter sp.]MDP2098037.1 type I-F CRISPR-associated protein Csy3 [Methylobacter sp.]MDP2428780.1 type I-F CRISPR-associated protein Csy3 [Methylobacter sp.]MDP3056110.1 type I-F CRISPR-associated protein Csy3 [Methylobacter sp.]MDP3363895.1 type I-F CRISPR-associated protein Csy3 [Methylobacter sp.]
MTAKQTKTTALTLPSVLAFSRKLEVSDALMTSGLWTDIDKSDQWQPITLHEKRNRATHSQYGAKEEDRRKPNLSWGDDATLPHDTDTLRVKFSLKILGQLEEPTACNTPLFEEKVVEIVKAYRTDHQFKELATRYANNIVNGRFLWRNRVGAESVVVKVKHGEQNWLFNNAYDYKLDEFSPTPADGNHPFAQLIAVIQRGLQGDGFEYLEITAFAKLGLGQHVWPSQEMVLGIPKGEKSKILFKLNDCAAMHSEKIGNALRTIDTWYTDDANAKAIAVEPYGSVTSRGEAYRIAKNDFYTLFHKWLKDGEIPVEQQHYVIATLIRGGVFGGNE